MKKIFILGMSPLPFENDRKVYGTGIRTWQFILPLLEKGHKICVCNYAIPSAYPDNYESQFNKEFIYTREFNNRSNADNSIFGIDKDEKVDYRNLKGKQEYDNSTSSGNTKAQTSKSSPGSKEKSFKYSFEYNILKKDDFENIELILRIFTRFKPDCIVGCTFYPSHIASRLLCYLKGSGEGSYSAVKSAAAADENKTDSKDYGRDTDSVKDIGDVPFWADLFGHVMAEAQARANIDGNDDCLFHYWNSEYNIISNADVFSCVSSRQKYALIGELGAAGRLNRHTSGYDFAGVVPCGISPDEYIKQTKNIFRGTDGIKKDDFVVLWTGGYNTWTDVDTLFKGLTLAMEKNPKIKFVSTGGEIPEQDMKTYPRFLSMINESPYRDRFIMKGWIAGEDVPDYYLEADVGINIDKDIYEVKLGSKNRILDWFRAGLCVISSNVCELTDIMEKEKIGYTFRPYDYKELAEKLTYLADHPDEVRRAANAGKEYGLANFNFNRTTERLQKWAASPVFSPDKGKKRKIFFKREEALKNLIQITLRQRKMIEERDRLISELRGIVEKGFVYRMYNYLRIVRRKIFG